MVVESATCNELSGESERSHRELERRERERGEGDREIERTQLIRVRPRQLVFKLDWVSFVATKF